LTDVNIEIKADLAGQQEKSRVLRNVPRAFFKNAEAWAGQTVRYIKQSYKGGKTFKRPPKEIDLRLGMKVVRTGEQATEILLGTGNYIGREEVVYAAIQEHGGWIVPKKARALTIPFPGVKGVAANYRPSSFILRTAGQPQGMIVTKTGKRGRIKPLFLLRRSVKLPARHWFSRPIAERMPELEEKMSPEGVWARAAQMGYKRGAAQGG